MKKSSVVHLVKGIYFIRVSKTSWYLNLWHLTIEKYVNYNRTTIKIEWNNDKTTTRS